MENCVQAILLFLRYNTSNNYNKLLVIVWEPNSFSRLLAACRLLWAGFDAD